MTAMQKVKQTHTLPRAFVLYLLTIHAVYALAATGAALRRIIGRSQCVES